MSYDCLLGFIIHEDRSSSFIPSDLYWHIFCYILISDRYKSVWGVGRHILGSQLFDYWWDTSGNMVEHYADGDLVNEDTPVGWGEAGHESLAVWGPECPKWFLD